jgi:four helix bundle protein
MQRASISIASNIAEGSERGGKDFLRFLSIARGSSSELRTQAYIAQKVGTISQEAMEHMVTETRRINRMLVSLANALGRSSEN